MVSNPIVPILRRGMHEGGVTQLDLWKRMVEVHGEDRVPSQPGTVGEWLRLKSHLPSTYLPAIVERINEGLVAKGKERLPIVFPKFGDEGDSLTGDAQSNPRYVPPLVKPLAA